MWTRSGPYIYFDEDESSISPGFRIGFPTVQEKFFNAQKGYGFISREGGADVFVHFSNIEGNGYRSLEEGQTVEFEVGQGRKGDEALKVTVV